MAKEAIIRTFLEHPRSFPAQNESAIEKGTILQLVDEKTVSGNVASGDPVIGICAREKVLNDGRPVAVYLRSIHDMVLCGVAKIGQKVLAATEENHIYAPVGSGKNGVVSGMPIIGSVLGIGATNETIQVLVNIGAA